MGIDIFLLGLSLGVATLESLSYLGFLSNHLHIPSIAIYIISIFTLSLLPFKETKSKKIIQKLTSLIAIFITLTYLCLNIIEAYTYENFIFAHFHINLKALNYLTYLSIFYYFFFKPDSIKQKKLPTAGLLASIAFFIIANLAGIIPEITKAVQVIISAPTATYGQKMTTTFPDFYPAIKIIESLTPESATIIIPPQKIPFVSEGNDAYINSFLYPRKIIHLPEDNTIPKGKVFIIIAKGAWPVEDQSLHGWPKIPISAKKIWKIDIHTNSFQEYQRDYHPETDAWDWGLIEVKHE